MKFSSISDRFFKICSFDKELLKNDNRRPYLVVLRLKFNNKRQDFAIPFRSNIPNYVPKNHYYSLPPRPSTKENHIHGLHYIKMFPIKKEFLQKFHIANDPYYLTILKIINENKQQIIQEAQNYINNYEKGIQVKYSTNINMIYLTIHGLVELENIAVADKSDNKLN